MKKKRNKGENNETRKFTLIDLVVCLVIVFALVYVGIRFFNAEKFSDDFDVEYEAVFIIEEEQNLFKIGDEVLTSNGENVIGKIIDISVSKAYYRNIDMSFGYVHENEISKDTSEISTNSNISDEITSVDASTPSLKNSNSSTNDKISYVETPIEGYVEVRVKVSAKLLYESETYYLNGKSLKVGDEIELTTKNYSAYGSCTSINDKPEAVKE